MPKKPPHFIPGGRTPDQVRKEKQQRWAKIRPDKDIQRLYRSTRWRELRQIVLTRFPACVYCLKHGRVTPSTVVDHIKPHRGDMRLFWDLENLHGLCKTCHSSTKQREENTMKEGE